MMQCPKCGYKSFVKVFKKTKGSFWCVKCNAEVKIKVKWLRLIPFVVCIYVLLLVIGRMVEILFSINIPAVIIAAIVGGICGAVYGGTTGIFTKIEPLPDKTSPNSGVCRKTS